MHLLDQSGHVLPPPCCKVCRTAGRKLRRIDAFFGRRVKIIVKVDAVHRVVLQKLGHALHHIVRRCRLGRVQIQPVAHCTHPFRVGVGKVVLCQIRRHGCRGPQPVGIQPRFHRKAAPVGLLQKDVQRVKTGVLPLHAGAQMAPREQLAFVKCIPEGPHLRKHRVQPKARAVFQHLHAPGAEAIRRGKIHCCPFQIAHPYGPPLACRQGRVLNRMFFCFRFVLFGKLFSAQPQPRTHTGSSTGPRQKGAPVHTARFRFRFFGLAPLGHRVSSWVLYSTSAAQPRAQASSTNMMFVQKARALMPAYFVSSQNKRRSASEMHTSCSGR